MGLIGRRKKGEEKDFETVNTLVYDYMRISAAICWLFMSTSFRFAFSSAIWGPSQAHPIAR
jgi:hypothetical protein